MSEPQRSVVPELTEPLSWPQICARYPDEWVCLVEIEWVNETDFEFQSARVVGHGTTRKEPLDQARPVRAIYEEIGHFFTGRPRALVPRFAL